MSALFKPAKLIGEFDEGFSVSDQSTGVNLSASGNSNTSANPNTGASLILKANWFEQFFAGEALELWRRAIAPESTEEEVSFLTEVLEVEPGGRLLDIPCGNGRLSLPLAQIGYRVTGLDFCSEFLIEAKAAAERLKTAATDSGILGVSFVKGDMRSYQWQECFDGAFCMGNSFGYFNREDTMQCLKSISASLKSGAKFVIDSSMIAESFYINGGEREWIQIDDMYMLIENIYSPRLSCVETNYTFIRDGKEEKRQSLHWIYSCGELSTMLESADFSVAEILSSTDFEPFELGSERMLLIAEKA